MFDTARPVTIETEATAGSVVGQDLVWPDGTKIDPKQLLNAIQLANNIEKNEGSGSIGNGSTGGSSTVFWRLIQEIPPNVVALANTATTGLYVITGAGTSATRSITSDTLTITNADGVSGNPKIELPGASALPAGETIHGRRVVFVEDGEVFHPDLGVNSHAGQCLGIAANAANIGDPVTVRSEGSMTDGGWSWSPGLIYCGAGGILTQTPPAAGWSLIVAVAVDATTIEIHLQIPIVRTP